MVKFCGFRDPNALETALGLGVDAIGLNLVAGSSRVIGDEALAVRLAKQCAGRAGVVWVVDGAPPTWFAGLVERFPASIVQCVDARLVLPHGLFSERHWPVVQLLDEQSLALALARPPGMILCDSGIGGTGRIGDWTLARRLAANRPTILAGGLTRDNVADALRTVKPAGVDVASGIERHRGTKDETLMRDFLLAVRSVGAQA